MDQKTSGSAPINNLITIIQSPADDHGVRMSDGTRFVLRDGTEITHVTRAVLEFEFGKVVTAQLDVAIHQLGNIEAHALLGLETVRAAAARYGFDLVKQLSD